MNHHCCSFLTEVLILGSEPLLGLLLYVDGNMCLGLAQVLKDLGAQDNEAVLVSTKNSLEFCSGCGPSYIQPGPQLQHHGEVKAQVNQGLSSTGCRGL